MRVQPGQRERGGERRAAGRPRRAGAACSAPGRQARRAASDGVGEQEGGAGDPHGVDDRGRAAQQRAGAGHAERDQDRVGDGADRDDERDVLAAQPLPQHERVLRADRDDQREAEAEAGEGGEEIHGATACRAIVDEVQLKILRMH